jgi:hypothetical protein
MITSGAHSQRVQTPQAASPTPTLVYPRGTPEGYMARRIRCHGLLHPSTPHLASMRNARAQVRAESAMDCCRDNTSCMRRERRKQSSSSQAPRTMLLKRPPCPFPSTHTIMHAPGAPGVSSSPQEPRTASTGDRHAVQGQL